MDGEIGKLKNIVGMSLDYTYQETLNPATPGIFLLDSLGFPIESFYHDLTLLASGKLVRLAPPLAMQNGLGFDALRGWPEPKLWALINLP